MLGYCNQVHTTQPLHPPWSTYTTGTQHWSARSFIITFLPVPVLAENAMASLSAFCGRRQTFPIVTNTLYDRFKNVSQRCKCVNDTLVTRYLKDERMSTFTNDRQTHAER